MRPQLLSNKSRTSRHKILISLSQPFESSLILKSHIRNFDLFASTRTQTEAFHALETTTCHNKTENNGIGMSLTHFLVFRFSVFRIRAINNEFLCFHRHVAWEVFDVKLWWCCVWLCSTTPSDIENCENPSRRHGSRNNHLICLRYVEKSFWTFLFSLRILFMCLAFSLCCSTKSCFVLAMQSGKFSMWKLLSILSLTAYTFAESVASKICFRFM